MPILLRHFLADATQKAARDLTEAFLALPEDMRRWKPGFGTRSAADQFAECALNNGYAAELIQSGRFTSKSAEDIANERADLATREADDIIQKLNCSVHLVIETLHNASDERLMQEVELRWGKTTLTETAAYPYWNMTYHLGQINMIRSFME
jgi:uncharacterized damage-inducible protein DinB